MSVVGGVMDFIPVYRNDYVPKKLQHPPRVPNPPDENCMLKVSYVNNIKLNEKINPKDPIDHFCKYDKAFYKDTINKLKNEEVAVGKMYFEKPLVLQPLQYRKDEMVKSLYQIDYCKRDFCYGRSMVDTKDFGVKLSDDIALPDTTMQLSYRQPSSIALRGIERTQSLRPVIDNTLKKKTEEILGTTCGKSQYEVGHCILGQAILEAKPYGTPQEAPECSRWKEPLPGGYLYRIR